MNAPLPSTPHVEPFPFFFDADPGTRFSLYHAPNPQVPARGAILYVHPFAEEMNNSRRMAALQARAFSALGFAVLQIDLFGCGDSCGDFMRVAGTSGSAISRWRAHGWPNGSTRPIASGASGWEGCWRWTLPPPVWSTA